MWEPCYGAFSMCYCRVLVTACLPVWLCDSCFCDRACLSWRCAVILFSRSSLSVAVGVRDEEAVISGLSPSVNLWQRDSTVQVRTARHTKTSTHSVIQQNNTCCIRMYLWCDPSQPIIIRVVDTMNNTHMLILRMFLAEPNWYLTDNCIWEFRQD